MRAEIVIQDKKGITELEGKGRSLSKEDEGMIALAEDILKVVKQAICRKNMLLQPFLRIFKAVPVEEDIFLETDGLHLFYQPERIIKALKKRELHKVEKTLLHMVCHGILGHFGIREQMENKELADRAMEYEVERLGRDMGWWVRISHDMDELVAGGMPLDAAKRAEEKQLNKMGARQIYYRALSYRETRDFLEEQEIVDDHDVWERRKKYHFLFEIDEDEGGFPTFAEGDDGIDLGVWKTAMEMVFGMAEKEASELGLQLKKAEGGKHWGTGSGSNKQHVKAAKENERSYRQVLEQFFHEKEGFWESPDSIDRMLYTYSLDLYGDMVLVEPEECSAEKVEFHTVAIAIDTSGSCSGKIMEQFIRETKNILRDVCGEATFESIILLQCDAVIQSEEVYTEPEDLPDIGRGMMVCGFGGTDFRPVFQRLSELEKRGKIKVDCLLYLTDGYGTFPVNRPNYPTFLVLAGRGSEDGIPAWAQKVYLDKKLEN